MCVYSPVSTHSTGIKVSVQTRHIKQDAQKKKIRKSSKGIVNGRPSKRKLAIKLSGGFAIKSMLYFLFTQAGIRSTVHTLS